MLKLFLITISIGIASCAIYDYCNADLCTLSNYQHITCGSTGTKSSSCSPDAVVPLAIPEEAKQVYVDLHNKLRNKFANGDESGFKSAAKMTTMEWDEELAEYAALNVLRCEYMHDCHSTPQMKNAGQNIYATTGAYVNNMTEMAEKATNSWYSEIEIATESETQPCCPNFKKTGHFTQIIADRANRIGCSAGHFVDPKTNQKMTYIVCNYSFTNLFGTPSYVIGAPTSKCKTGNNPNYPALCSSSEDIDPNDTS